MINENTAFENYYSQSNIHGGYASKRDFVAGWQAAKQSMQGEAVVWRRRGKYKWFYRETAPTPQVEKTQGSGWIPLYTHAPDSAARIAELEAEIAQRTKELEEARKDAVRYIHMRKITAQQCGKPEKEVDDAIDASLNIKGGSE